MSQHTTGAATSLRPVVTIFEHYGAGADYVGRQVVAVQQVGGLVGAASTNRPAWLSVHR